MIYDFQHAYRLLNGGYVLATCREGLGCWPWAADAAEARGSRTLLCSCVQSETCCWAMQYVCSIMLLLLAVLVNIHNCAIPILDRIKTIFSLWLY